MRRFMIHSGERFEISPYSVWVDDLKESPQEIERRAVELLEKWESEFKWQGANDIAYRDFLRWNKLDDLDDFSEETLAEASFEIVEKEDPTVDHEMVYGAIDWAVEYGTNSWQVNPKKENTS